MPDYAGAVQAIKDRVAANWTTTPVAWSNDTGPSKVDGGKNPIPWVFGEIVNTASEIHAAGIPGNQIWLYEGFIYLHVFVPADSGSALATQYAVNIGEIFRGKIFFDDGAGHFVRTWSPRVDGGDQGSEDGLWFRVTATIDFQYWHRG